MGSSNHVISQVSFARSSNVVDFMSRLRYESTNEPAIEEQSTHRFETPSEVPHVEEATVTPELKEAMDSVVIPEKQGVDENHSFSSHIEYLLSITPRCPEHEHVELAVDSEGCMHVLANADDLRDAAIVAAWVTRHHSLLSLACGGLQLDTTGIPIQHLFTDNAVSVADLHGSGVRLHLLTDVEVDGHAGSFSTPLN